MNETETLQSKIVDFVKIIGVFYLLVALVGTASLLAVSLVKKPKKSHINQRELP